MAYTGAGTVREARELLGKGLERLQAEREVPADVMAVATHIAQAVGALFEAEKANAEDEGRAATKRGLGFLSQTLALLQDFRTEHPAVSQTTELLAQATSMLFPLTRSPSHLAAATEASSKASIPPAAAVPAEAVSESGRPPRPSSPSSLRPTMTSMSAASSKPEPKLMTMPDGPREQVEANVGATTDTNFYVGFSGEISEGGVFVATYTTLAKGAPVDLLITLPGGFELRVGGIVHFATDPLDFSSDTEPGMGIRFVNLAADHRDLILRFVRKRPPMFYET